MVKPNPKITVQRKANKLVFDALGIKKPRCHYCGKRVNMANWGGIVGKSGKIIVICRNVCCLMRYIDTENNVRKKGREKKQ